MAGISLTQIGSSGIQSGLEQAQRAAQDIARVGAGDADQQNSSLNSLVESSVDLLQAKNQVQASAQVVNAGDEMLGTIIDTIA
ncbi:MAG: flagellar biosynthesis protein FlgE [Pseudomonadales bacterium]|nr:flagellar biosynthesis protein FlgE [Gammaproteobacteria bacterium]NNL56617.1 flagellar biosynthesis protein FlgE [Pseudomonadales bacterium]